MPIVALVTFYVALLGLFLLFGLKSWEEYDRFRLLPKLRRKADEKALILKDIILRFLDIAKDFPKYSLLVMRIILHTTMVAFANIAGATERGAHRVADFVSHRHRFERKETNSDFLKKVSARKEELVEKEKPGSTRKVGRKKVGKKT